MFNIKWNLTRIWDLFFGRTALRKHRRRARYGLQLEPLEQRQMLTVVSSILPTATGFVAQLDQAIDPGSIHLYSGLGGSQQAADVVLHGANSGDVRRYVAVDANSNKLTFVKSDLNGSGLLAPGTYTVTLGSGTSGIVDAAGQQLDGDADGQPGGNFVANFTVAPLASNTVSVSLPDFSRGPAQSINLPASSNTGIPLTLSNGDGVYSVDLRINYDPSLLHISGASVGSGMPNGSLVSINNSTPGLAILSFSSPSPLGAGAKNFVNLQADVPASATYGAAEILHIDGSSLSINDRAIPAVGADAVHLAAYLGDTSGNAIYSGWDTNLLSRVALSLDTGFAAYSLTDPSVVADIDGDGAVTQSDAGLLSQAIVGLSVPQIPALPPNQAPSFTMGPDQSVLEGAVPQTVTNWATNISAGPANEAGQQVTFTVVNDNQSLFSVQPTVISNGTLSYTLAPNANGTAIVSVTLHDDGGIAHGGADTSATQQFAISVLPVNHAPSFIIGADQTTSANSGSLTVPNWATQISKGPANESNQVLNFFVTDNTNPSLFAATPSVDAATGALSYALVADAYGSATVSFALHDDGGTSNGGSDTSAPQSFTINVTAPPPKISIDNVTVSQSSGTATFTVSLSNPSANPVSVDWHPQDGSATRQTPQDGPNDPQGASDYSQGAWVRGHEVSHEKLVGYNVNAYDIGHMASGYQVNGYEASHNELIGYNVNGYDVGHDVQGYLVDGYEAGHLGDGFFVNAHEAGHFVNGYNVDGYEAGHLGDGFFVNAHEAGHFVNGYNVDGYEAGHLGDGFFVNAHEAGHFVNGYNVDGYEAGHLGDGFFVNAHEAGHFVNGYNVDGYEAGHLGDGFFVNAHEAGHFVNGYNVDGYEAGHLGDGFFVNAHEAGHFVNGYYVDGYEAGHLGDGFFVNAHEAGHFVNGFYVDGYEAYHDVHGYNVNYVDDDGNTVDGFFAAEAPELAWPEGSYTEATQQQDDGWVAPFFAARTTPDSAWIAGTYHAGQQWVDDHSIVPAYFAEQAAADDTWIAGYTAGQQWIDDGWVDAPFFAARTTPDSAWIAGTYHAGQQWVDDHSIVPAYFAEQAAADDTWIAGYTAGQQWIDDGWVDAPFFAARTTPDSAWIAGTYHAGQQWVDDHSIVPAYFAEQAAADDTWIAGYTAGQQWIDDGWVDAPFFAARTTPDSTWIAGTYHAGQQWVDDHSIVPAYFAEQAAADDTWIAGYTAGQQWIDDGWVDAPFFAARTTPDSAWIAGTYHAGQQWVDDHSIVPAYFAEQAAADDTWIAGYTAGQQWIDDGWVDAPFFAARTTPDSTWIAGTYHAGQQWVDDHSIVPAYFAEQAAADDTWIAGYTAGQQWIDDGWVDAPFFAARTTPDSAWIAGTYHAGQQWVDDHSIVPAYFAEQAAADDTWIAGYTAGQQWIDDGWVDAPFFAARTTPDSAWISGTYHAGQQWVVDGHVDPFFAQTTTPDDAWVNGYTPVYQSVDDGWVNSFFSPGSTIDPAWSNGYTAAQGFVVTGHQNDFFSPGDTIDPAWANGYTAVYQHVVDGWVPGYWQDGGTLTFAPGETSRTITVGIVNEGEPDDIEQFSILLSNPQGGTIERGQGTGTILNDVNHAPSFWMAIGGTIPENFGPQTISNWASSISAGPANEMGQLLTFHVTTDNPSLFAVQPSISSDGTLIFTPAQHAFGTATMSVALSDNGGTANGGVDTSAPQSFTITVIPVNQAPSFTKGADQMVLEDSAPQSVTGWSNNISAGPANESGQHLNFVVANNSNPSLFSVQPAINSNGTLTYTLAATANGTANLSVVLHDDGGTAHGGVDTSAAQQFTISVTPVNHAPSFQMATNRTVAENSGPRTIFNWASNITAGPANEASQSLTFHVTTDNPSLFSVQPSISPNGTLTFTPAQDAIGTATMSVTLSDDGGTANGGFDTSAPQQFTITVSPVNHAPSFTKGADQTILEDAGSQSVAGWATNLSAGPANEASQHLNFIVTGNSNPSLFSVQPSVSSNGTLTYSLAPTANGTARVSLALHDDGGTAGGGADTSASQQFTITVQPVNHAPTFTKGANQTAAADAGAQSVAGWATGISAGPANEAAQHLNFVITGNSNSALFATQPSISANGTLTYQPDPAANGTATISVTLHDDGGTAHAGVDTSAVQTFAIHITPAALPTASIDNVFVDPSSGVADFTVSLSKPSPQPVTIQWRPQDGTATRRAPQAEPGIPQANDNYSQGTWVDGYEASHEENGYWVNAHEAGHFVSGFYVNAYQAGHYLDGYNVNARLAQGYMVDSYHNELSGYNVFGSWVHGYDVSFLDDNGDPLAPVFVAADQPDAAWTDGITFTEDFQWTSSSDPTYVDGITPNSSWPAGSYTPVYRLVDNGPSSATFVERSTPDDSWLPQTYWPASIYVPASAENGFFSPGNSINPGWPEGSYTAHRQWVDDHQFVNAFFAQQDTPDPAWAGGYTAGQLWVDDHQWVDGYVALQDTPDPTWINGYTAGQYPVDDHQWVPGYWQDGGTLTFAPGETSKTIEAGITIPATPYSHPLQFYVNLSNPTGATIVLAQGVATIAAGNDPIGIDFSQSSNVVDEGSTYSLVGDIRSVMLPVEADNAVEPYSVVVKWGDNSTSTYVSHVAGQHLFTMTHVYADNSTPSITATVTGIDGLQATSSLPITVNNVAPTVGITASALAIGTPVTLSGTIADPGTKDSFTVNVSWGDGQSEDLNVAAGETTFTGSHLYADPPFSWSTSYTINVTVTDKDGDSGSTSTTVSMPANWWTGYSYQVVRVDDESTPTGNERVSGAVDDDYQGWRGEDIEKNADEGVLKNDHPTIEEEVHVTRVEYKMVLLPDSEGLSLPPDGHAAGDSWWEDTDFDEWRPKDGSQPGISLVVVDKSPELDSVTLNNDGSFTAKLKAEDELPDDFDGNVTFKYRIEGGDGSESSSGDCGDDPSSTPNTATVALKFDKFISIITDSNNDGKVNSDDDNKSKETGTGAYLQVDNAAGETIDLDLTKVKVRPGLQEVRIDGPAATLQTTVTVSVLNGGNKVKLWADKDGTQALTNPTWQVGVNQPVQLSFYVEATDVGQIDLKVVRGSPFTQSKADQVRFTAVKVDVDVVGDNTQPLTELLKTDPVQLDGIVPRFAQGVGEQIPLTPVRVQLNIPDNPAAQATIDFDDVALGIYKNADESGGILRSGDTLPLQNGTTTLYVGHWLDDPTTAQQQTIKVKWASSNGKKTFTDEIKVAPVILQVTKVPDYLFGGATNATPITFQVKGVDKIQVGQSGPTIKMYNYAAGGADPVLTYDAGTRYTKSTPDGQSFGSGSQGNGESSSYTAFIATSAIAALDGTAKQLNNASSTYFQAIVDASLSPTRLQTLRLKSTNLDGTFGSDPYVSKRYYDSSVPTIEFGGQLNPQWFDTITVQSSRQSTQIYANGKYLKDDAQIASGPAGPYIKITPMDLSRQGPTPHEVAGFNPSTGIDESMSLIKANGRPDGFDTLYTITGQDDAEAKLVDNIEHPSIIGNNMYDAGGVGVSLTAVTDTIGAMVYVSYGGISLPGILPQGEKAMDLRKNDGYLSLALMPDTTFTANTSTATASAGVYPIASSGFNIMWALAEALAAAHPLTGGIAGAFAGIAATVSAIAEDAAKKAKDDTANANGTAARAEAGFLLDRKQYTPDGLNLLGGSNNGKGWGEGTNGDFIPVANVGWAGTVAVGQQISAAFSTYAIAQAKSAFPDQSITVSASLDMSQLPNTAGKNGSQLGLDSFRVVAY